MRSSGTRVRGGVEGGVVECVGGLGVIEADDSRVASSSLGELWGVRLKLELFVYEKHSASCSRGRYDGIHLKYPRCRELRMNLASTLSSSVLNQHVLRVFLL